MNIAVIGAGPAGCAAAFRLHEKGHQVSLFEKGPSPGGRSLSFRQEGYTLDTGAGFITNFYPRVFALSKELGFAQNIKELIRVSGLYADGQTAKLNVGSTWSFLSFPLLGTMDKLKMAWWTAGLTLKRKQYDLVDPAVLRKIDTESITEYARSNLNENIYQSLIRPGIEPFWYFYCEEVSAAMMISLTAQAAFARFYFLVYAKL